MKKCEESDREGGKRICGTLWRLLAVGNGVALPLPWDHLRTIQSV